MLQDGFLKDIFCLVIFPLASQNDTVLLVARVNGVLFSVEGRYCAHVVFLPLCKDFVIDNGHSRPQSPSFLGHVVLKPLVGYKLSRVALGTRMNNGRLLEITL